MENKAFEILLQNQKIEYKKAEPMCNHTSFKIGGPADYFISVKTESELCFVLEHLKKIGMKYFILGKGSNILVSDKGIEGAVICLSSMDKITVEGETVTALAGASLASVCVAAAENSLGGLEFAYGIPGCVGGALFMNAGAYGGEMSQVVVKAEFLTENGEKKSISLENMHLGYRNSIFRKESMIITSVTFKLQKGEKSEIQAKMNDFMNRRKQKQPLEFPSAGSTFKRPEGHFAGALIEKNSLKGVSVGGAMVSEKHAGFVINYNRATSGDVKELMRLVQKTVFETEGIMLEPEVIFVGKE